MLLELSRPITQEQFGALVGITQQAVSDLVVREQLPRAATGHEWLVAYCANLREQAAGRAAAGDLDLAAERARLAHAQADRVEMENAKQRKELAPVSVITEVLSRVSAELAAILESLPVQLKRRAMAMTPADLEFMTGEIARARNLMANLNINLDDLDDGDPESDPLRLEAA